MSLPPPIQNSEFVTDPAYLEACEKYGHAPLEFLSYPAPQPPLTDPAQVEAENAELEARRLELEIGSQQLEAIIKHNPERIRRALGLAEVELKSRWWGE